MTRKWIAVFCAALAALSPALADLSVPQSEKDSRIAFDLHRAQKVIARICANPSSSDCQKARGILEDAEQLHLRIERCKHFHCGQNELAQLNSTVSSLNERYSRFHHDLGLIGYISDGLLSPLRAIDFSFIRSGIKNLGSNLTALEKRTSALQKEGGATSKDGAIKKLELLGLEGGAALDDFLSLSLLADRSNYFADSTESDARAVAAAAMQSQSLNPLASRLAALRDRLIALQKKLGVKSVPPLSSNDIERLAAIRAGVRGNTNVSLPKKFFETEGVPSIVGGEVSHKLKQATISSRRTGSTSNLLNMPRPLYSIPSPNDNARASNIPYVLWKNPQNFITWYFMTMKYNDKENEFKDWATKEFTIGKLHKLYDSLKIFLKKGDFDPHYIAYLNLLKRVGAAKTIGHPKAWASFVFMQSGGDCDVMAQMQALQFYGALKRPRSYVEQFKEQIVMVDEARRLDIYHKGTEEAYLGSLLTAHGIVIKEHVDADVKDLNQALKMGHAVIADIDSGILWNIKKSLDAGHGIIVTGALMNRLNGQVLGYYVNDSGMGIGGRLVAANQFLASWKSTGRFFIEMP